MEPGLSMSAPLAAAANSSGKPMQGSILVVDDDAHIRDLFLELFQSEGVAIRVAGTGQEALALLKQAPPSLVMVDVTLPDQDGISLLEQAQQHDRRIIGVVMTGAPSIELAVRAMKAGATDFLMKPVQNDVVLLTARRLLELYRLRRENTVLKHAVVRAGGLHVQNLVLQTFGEDGALRGQDGLTEYERGVAEGERRVLARDDARRQQDCATVAQERALLANAVRAFNQALSGLHQTVENDVVSLAFQLASKILRENAAQSREQIASQVKAALATLRESAKVTIQAHPADAALLEAVRAELSQMGDVTITLHVAPDPSLPRGSCLLHTENQVIDASLDTQLLRLGEALRARGQHVAR